MTVRHKILVIDDEQGVRDTICENLEVCGFDVKWAADGEEGMSLIDPQNPPAVMITDIIMPKQEGIETIMKMRKIYPNVKLIAISGGGRSQTMDFLELAKKLGADAVLPKPIDIDELERTIRGLAS